MDSFIDRLHQAHNRCPECPSPKVIRRFFDDVLGILFPEHANEILKERGNLEMKFFDLRIQLGKILKNNSNLHHGDGEKLANRFFDELEQVFNLLHEDLEAMFEGDPAAKSKTEIIRCYPGFYAVAAYRIANSLHQL
ncbi:MAG: serine acetyltransferase, partial [Cyclobacteriaceae bacterium]